MSLPPADPLIGQVLRGRYRIERTLGSGGAGAVYAARQLELDRPVAIKVLRPELSGDVTITERFRREARAAGSLRHPNIAQVIDFGDAEGGQPAFIALELVKGDVLTERLRREPRIEPARAVRWMVQILSALDAAHRAGIVHRDLKPGNLVVQEIPGLGDSVKLLDFGIAQIKAGPAYQRLTQTGAVLGTPRYMSPEQVSGRAVDARTDIWSAGVLLYRMLTGSMPFDGTPDVVIRGIVSGAPERFDPRLGLAPALEAAVLRALEKDPQRRFGSAAEMGAALAAGLEVRASQPPRASHPPTAAMAVATLSQPPMARTSVPHTLAGAMTPRASMSVPPPAATTSLPSPSSMPRPPWWLVALAAVGALVVLGASAGTIAYFALPSFAPGEAPPPPPPTVATSSPASAPPTITGALPGGAPRRGDLSTYRAVADRLVTAEAPDVTPLGYSVMGVVAADGTVDFDAMPFTSFIFLYRRTDGRCLAATLYVGALDAVVDQPCVGEPLPFTAPPLQHIVATAWSYCPTLAERERGLNVSITYQSGSMIVAAGSTSGDLGYMGTATPDGTLVPMPSARCPGAAR